MSNFSCQPTRIPAVLLVTTRIFTDERGAFFETYQRDSLAALGIEQPFVQDNQSFSKRGVLRGLHYQIQQPQGKLVRVIQGEIYDVAVDLRRNSPTFGQSVGTYLSAANRLQIWLPVGFAHGFYVVSESAEVLYKTTDYYAPQYERTLRWNDPALGIDWPLLPAAPPILSGKDQAGLYLHEAETFA